MVLLILVHMISRFNQFEQYLAKNGKKQPKAESVITQEVLRKYAKEIKQAKLEEFRSFLDFTAMTFRDKRRHKIDNYVTGRWVLTIKVDKDGQFKKGWEIVWGFVFCVWGFFFGFWVGHVLYAISSISELETVTT